MHAWKSPISAVTVQINLCYIIDETWYVTSRPACKNYIFESWNQKDWIVFAVFDLLVFSKRKNISNFFFKNVQII